MITSKFSISDIAQALGCSKRNAEMQAKNNGWSYETIAARGGRKRLYNLADLPADIQAKVTLHLIRTGQLEDPAATEPQAQTSDTKPATRTRSNTYNRDDLWAWFETRKQSIKDEALRRAGICNEVRRLIESGLGARPAIAQVAAATEGVTEGTLRNWWYGTSNILGASKVRKDDYAPALAPRYYGSTKTAELCDEAWEYIKTDWLRAEKPTVAAVYRRAKSIAAERGWTLPSQATIARRLKTEVPWTVQVYRREGPDAMKAHLPHMTRTKDHLFALEAVNADGHIFDVRVELPTGGIGRPVMVAWQDLYSGKILAWRISETLNQHTVRLSFGDLVEKYGIPEHAYLDNGREFANKWLTGQLKHRFRFKIREDEPEGIFKTLGLEIHWTTPYHGQAKPIERAFRDLCENVAKDPRFAGAYTGNMVTNKPANYGENAIAWETFVDVVNQGIAEHNGRTGRRSEVCRGRSFDQAFADSYREATIRKATAEQRRLWLLAGEGLTVQKGGAINLKGNLYSSDELGPFQGKKVIVRFDPEDLTKAVHAYTLGSEYIGEATCKRAAFDDAQAASDFNRARNQKLRAIRDLAKAETKMDIIEAAQLLPRYTEPELPKAGAIAPMFEPARKVANGGWALEDEQDRPDERRMLELLPFLPRRTEDDE